MLNASLEGVSCRAARVRGKKRGREGWEANAGWRFSFSKQAGCSARRAAAVVRLCRPSLGERCRKSVAQNRRYLSADLFSVLPQSELPHELTPPAPVLDY